MNPREKYQLNLKTLISIGYPQNDIFIIDGSLGEDEYYKLFKFYQSNLEYHYKNYCIDPTLYFIRPSTDVNARAIKSPNQLMIGTNRGTIEFLFVNFKNNVDLFNDNPELKPYLDLENKLDYNLHELAYQANLHFTFYHEMGHLVQFSNRGIDNASINEHSSKTEVFNIQKHIDEIDSDTFSSLYTSGHVFQYMKNYFYKSPENDELKKIITIITSSITLYLLSFPSYTEIFYLRESTHPHVTIRILNVINVVINSFINLVKSKGIHVSATKDEITKDTLILTKHLALKMNSSIDFTIMVNAVVNRGKSMEKYLNILSNCAYKDPNSAWRQWNKT